METAIIVALNSSILTDWITGKGLRLGDSRNRVVEIYGEPNSSEPVVRGDADFELLEFDFGWAGADVPQAMQVYCERDSGRVVEIALLAAPGQERSALPMQRSDISGFFPGHGPMKA